MAAESQSSGSFWMPLMAGYMMGRLMGGSGFAQQPLFTSRTPPARQTASLSTPAARAGPATAGGRTMTVPKTAMAPKPAVTNTVTRGGFGETVAKQSSMQRSSATSNSGSRSMGG